MTNFIWEPSSEHYKSTILREIFHEKIYEKIFEVEKDDIVFDIGASLGPFTYSILHKEPKHVFCVEPSVNQMKTLMLNTNFGPVTYINKAITNYIGVFPPEFAYENDADVYTTTFKNIIEDYNLNKIDFLKTDCEGGEYDIFNIENLFWIKNNVRKISGEWHLGDPFLNQKFREFRDVYLRVFPNHKIYSFDGIDITSRLWTEEFLNYFTEITVYIDNR